MTAKSILGALLQGSVFTWQFVQQRLRHGNDKSPADQCLAPVVTPAFGGLIVGHRTSVVVGAGVAGFIIAVLVVLLVVAIATGLVLAIMLLA